MPISSWTPKLSDVGAILRSRTKTVDGDEVGTFNADTRPTGDQVSALISQGASDVATVTGSEIPTNLWQDAKSVAAYATALRVELGYFPEQIGSGRSPYNAIKDLFDGMLARLLKAIESERDGGDGSAAPLKPVASFPMTGDPFLLGRGTRW